jgi:hypothetical protein
MKHISLLLLAITISNQCIAGQNVVSGRTFYDATDTYDQNVYTLAITSKYTRGTGISIPANKELDSIRQQDTITLGSGSIYKFVSSENTSSQTSDINSSMYGAVHTVYNSGAGTTKAVYGAAIANSGSYGVLGAIIGRVHTVSTSGESFGLQLGFNTYATAARPIDQAVRIEGDYAGTSINYGILINNSIAVNNSGLQMYAAGSGDFLTLKDSSGYSNLFRVKPNGKTEIGSNAAFGLGEKLSVAGFAAIGTTYGPVGVIGDTGAGRLVIGSTSQHNVEVRAGNVEIMSIATSKNVIVGTNQLPADASNGYLWIPSFAGAPTGAPLPPYQGAVPLTFDQANSKFCVYSGTWKCVQLQ